MEDIDYYAQYLQRPSVESFTNALSECALNAPDKLQNLKKSLIKYAPKYINKLKKQEQVAAFFKQTKLIATADDFSDISIYLDNQHKEMLYDTMKDSLPNFANSSDDIVKILDKLPITRIDEAMVLLAQNIEKYTKGSDERNKIEEKIKEFKGEGRSLFHRFIDILFKLPYVINVTPQFIISKIFSDKTIGQKARLIQSLSHFDLSNPKIVELFRKEPELLNFISDELKIRIGGHRLGLHGDEHEALYLEFANLTNKSLFKQLSEKKEEANLEPITNPLTPVNIIKNLNEHGDIQGIHSLWEGHVFSFHLIKEHDQTHIIYVNRGQAHEKAGILDQTVMVYTFSNEEAKTEIPSLRRALKTKNRKIISEYIKTNLEQKKNPKLTKTLEKSTQKTGNCSIANANIAWHFKLASRLMKSNPQMNFADAYTQTKGQYKELRMADRADAFKSLISLRHAYNENNFNRALFETMKKMVNKDLVDSKRHTVSFLLKHLKEHSANQLSPLFDLITSDNFLTPPITEPMRYARLKWAEAIAALLPLNQTQNATLQILQQDPNAQIERVIQTLERTDNTNLHKIIISNPTYINYLQPDTILGLLSRLDSDLNIEISLIGQLNKGNLKTISERFTAPWVVLKKEMLTYFFKKNPECLGYAKPDVIEALAIQKQTAEPNQDMKTQSMREQLNKLQKKDEENNMPSAKYNK